MVDNQILCSFHGNSVENNDGGLGVNLFFFLFSVVSPTNTCWLLIVFNPHSVVVLECESDRAWYRLSKMLVVGRHVITSETIFH